MATKVKRLSQQEKITKLFKASSTIVTLPANATIPVNSAFYVNSSTINCTTSTSGFGGIDTGSVAASTFYYVYAVVQSGILGLVASTSATSPTGFNSYRKVGAFYTDGSSDIFKAYWFGEINRIVSSARIVIAGTVSDESDNWINGNATHPATGQWVVTFNSGIFSKIPNISANSASTATLYDRAFDIIQTGATNVTVRQFANTTGAAADGDFVIFSHKSDIDAIQPDWNLE